MNIARLQLSQLSPGERADLESALGDPTRFHSDGREIGIAGIVMPVLLIPLEIVLFFEVRSDYSVYGNPLSLLFEYFPSSLRMLWSTTLLPYYGIAALGFVIVAVPVYALRTRGRHGYAITSFGVVRIRGNKLRMLRYEDISEVKVGSREYPQHRILTGLEARRKLIETHVQGLRPHARSDA